MSGNLLKVMTYRAGDTFSYGLAVPYTLPTSAWTATVTLKDPTKPNLAGPVGPSATVVAQNVNAADATKTDYQVVLYGPPDLTETWTSYLEGYITFIDGNTPPNRVSTCDFALKGR
jgi:hypothetical protein